MNRNKGSLTIEACISFTVFLSFMYFLLMFVQLAIVDITLDAATRETAKIIATSAYPISLLNEIEDDADKKAEEALKPTSLLEITTKANVNTIIDTLFLSNIEDTASKDNISLDKLEDILKGNISSVATEAAAGIGNILKAKLFDALDGFMQNTKYKIAASIFDKCIEGSFINIDKSNLIFNVVEFPQSDKRYEVTKNAYIQYDLLGDEIDFGKDDAIVSVEYTYPIKLPFMPTYNLKLNYTAIERGWVNGGNGVYTSWEEKLELGNDLVFVTKTGKKYHRRNCYYLKESKIAITRKDATEKYKYTPCSKCNP